MFRTHRPKICFRGEVFAYCRYPFCERLSSLQKLPKNALVLNSRLSDKYRDHLQLDTESELATWQ